MGFVRSFVDGFRPMQDTPHTTAAAVPVHTPPGHEHTPSDTEKASIHKYDLESEPVPQFASLEQPTAAAAPAAGAPPEKLQRHLNQRHMQMIAFGGRCVPAAAYPHSPAALAI